MGQPVYVVQAFQFYQDDGGDGGATLIGIQSADPTLDVDTVYRVRYRIANTGAKDGTASFELYYSTTGVWTGEEVDITATSAKVEGEASANTTWTLTDDDSLTAARLTGGSGTWVNGRWDNDGIAESSITLAQGPDYTEVEFCFLIDAADVADEDVIYLRVTAGGSQLDTYTADSTVTVNEAAGNPQTATAVTAVGTFTANSSTATYQSQLSATATTAIATWTPNDATATYEAELSAVAVTAVATWTANVAATAAPYAINASTGEITITDPSYLAVAQSWEVVVRVTDDIPDTDDFTITIDLVAGAATATAVTAVATFTANDATPTYESQLSASAVTAIGTWTPNDATATYEAELSASAVTAVATWTPNDAAATSVSELTATATTAIATWTPNDATPTYESELSATAVTAVATWTANDATASSGTEAQATAVTAVATFTANDATPTYESQLSASAATAVATWTANDATASYPTAATGSPIIFMVC